MSVPRREKPANMRQGWKDRSGQGIKMSSHPVKVLGIYSTGEDIFLKWGPQPFLTIYKSFLYVSTFIWKRLTYYIIWEVN